MVEVKLAWLEKMMKNKALCALEATKSNEATVKWTKKMKKSEKIN